MNTTIGSDRAYGTFRNDSGTWAEYPAETRGQIHNGMFVYPMKRAVTFISVVVEAPQDVFGTPGDHEKRALFSVTDKFYPYPFNGPTSMVSEGPAYTQNI